MSRIEHLPLSALRESPFNPRKTFSAAALQELADSIRTQGVLQPIVARPLYPEGAPTDVVERYEIVFGHRRYRASLMAERDTAPVLINEMDDQAAAIAQVHENVQREDVSALEEADSYAHLQKAHNLNADQIAAAVGKSRSHVYGRLKLVNAAPAVRQAVAERGLPADIALEVARLRGHGVQQAALNQIKAFGADDWLSVREAKRRLRSMFTFTLGSAQFDPADALLVRGCGACTSCPKLARNDPDLHELPADVCTDSECFGRKAATHADQQAAQLRRQGLQVIDGDAAAAAMPYPSGNARYLRGYEPYDAIPSCDDEQTPESTLNRLRAAGREVPEPLYLRNPETHELVRVWRDADYQAICTAVRDLDRAAVAGASTWTPAERAFVSHDSAKAVLHAVLAAMMKRERTADDLRVILLREFDLSGDLDSHTSRLMGLDPDRTERDAFEGRERAWWEERLARLTGAELGRLLLGMALEEQLDAISPWGASRETAAQRVALARHYGVDPAEAAAAANSQSQTDDAGCAGERCANTSELFEEAAA